jgi:hypothetical protein
VDSADFNLAVDSQLYPFQATEAQQPGRTRGYDYKQQAAGNRPKMYLEDWEPGTRYGHEWIREGVVKKRKKNYASEDNLHLVVYANFGAYQLEYAQLRDTCTPVLGDFASVWVVTGDSICTLRGHPNVGVVKGCEWVVIEESSLKRRA